MDENIGTSGTDVTNTTDERTAEAAELSETEPVPADPAIAEANEAPVEHQAYQQLVLRRWKMIESMLGQSFVGLRNANVDLRKIADARQFNEQNFGMTNALLSMTETIARAHNGFMDAPPEADDRSSKPEIYVPDKKIVIAH